MSDSQPPPPPNLIMSNCSESPLIISSPVSHPIQMRGFVLTGEDGEAEEDGEDGEHYPPTIPVSAAVCVNDTEDGR